MSRGWRLILFAMDRRKQNLPFSWRTNHLVIYCIAHEKREKMCSFVNIYLRERSTRGQHCTVTLWRHRFLQCCQLRDFWGETELFSFVMWSRSHQWERARLWKISLLHKSHLCVLHRSSSGNTLKDSSEEGQPLPPAKPKDKVSALLAFIAWPE